MSIMFKTHSLCSVVTETNDGIYVENVWATQDDEVVITNIIVLNKTDANHVFYNHGEW